ncbi:MAG: precorrin-2 C(20)-methyltransferase, partial [Rhodospirillaceae bacterium]|nr:precorrin-2 C(20)-methyltransferase [Rhodospirillaceae bacterium]
TVVPGPLDEAELEARIKASPAVAIMKVGRHLDKIRRVLGRLNLMNNAHYVERATMDEQRVMPLAELNGEGAPYFSMVLVRHGEDEAGI